MENRGATPLGRAWRLYFSQGVTPDSGESRINQILLDGRYGYLEPGDTWPGLEPLGRIDIPIENWLFSGLPSVARQGFHFSQLDANEETLLGSPTLVAPELAPLEQPRFPPIEKVSPSSDSAPLTPAHVFDKNASAQAVQDKLTIVPAAVECQFDHGERFEHSGFRVESGELTNEPSLGPTTDLFNEASYLKTFSER